MIWNVPKIWEDGDVWILGGGPSIPKLFNVPDKVIKDVVSRKFSPNTYSQYMQSIHNKHVIGVNVAYLLGDWIDMVFFGDSAFFLKHMDGLAEFKGLKVSCASNVASHDWVKYTPKDGKHNKGITKQPHLVSWNGNSGAAAISVAVHTGAKRVILLGFDMSLGDIKNQHWHDVYERGPAVTEKRLKKLPFNRHLRGFAGIKRDADTMGVEILNCSPNSTIKEFRKVTLEELL